MLRHSAHVLALLAAVLPTARISAGDSGITPLRALTDAPLRYANAPVTVTGRFLGRVGHTPAASPLAPPRRGRWDFMVADDEAAVWVSGVRPAGWEFDLDPLSAADAARGVLLEIRGTVRVSPAHRDGCDAARPCRRLWIQASDLRPAAPSQAVPQALLRSPLLAPVIVFHDPIAGEKDVRRDAVVRLQFSRAVVPESLSEHIRISYVDAGVSTPAIPAFVAEYSAESRGVTIRFSEPLAPRRTVRIELTEGIVGTSGMAAPPTSYRFSTEG